MAQGAPLGEPAGERRFTAARIADDDNTGGPGTGPGTDHPRGSPRSRAAQGAQFPASPDRENTPDDQGQKHNDPAEICRLLAVADRRDLEDQFGDKPNRDDNRRPKGLADQDAPGQQRGQDNGNDVDNQKRRSFIARNVPAGEIKEGELDQIAEDQIAADERAIFRGRAGLNLPLDFLKGIERGKPLLGAVFGTAAL